jgi:8-oxo-dGTP pyrophosphatase MutT (NUDIX family)
VKHKVGVIPFDIRGDQIAILFVTSQTRGRWIFPKGTLEEGENQLQAAKREAYEEAGVIGDLLKYFPITLPITKKNDHGVTKVPVTFYPLLVTDQLEDWPEKKIRQRHWSLLSNANKVTDRADFLQLINQFNQLSLWILEAAKNKKEPLPKQQPQEL